MTKFLKVIVLLMSLPVLALCIFVVPSMGIAASQWLPTFPMIQYTTWFALYASSVFYFVALYKAFQLLRLIEKGHIFSERGLSPLNSIKYCGICISVLHLTVLPVFYLFAQADDAPGVIFVGLFVPVASAIIAVFAALLKHLLTQAITRQIALT